MMVFFFLKKKPAAEKVLTGLSIFYECFSVAFVDFSRKYTKHIIVVIKVARGGVMRHFVIKEYVNNMI